MAGQAAENVIIQDLIDTMTQHGDHSRKFEKQLSSYVDKHLEVRDLKELEDLMNHTEPDHRYLGFYGMFICHRRLMQYSKLREMLDAHRNEFEHYESYAHLYTLCHIDHNDRLATGDELMGHISDAENVIKTFRRLETLQNPVNLAGVLHAFADLVITYCERYKEHQQEILKIWGRKAEQALAEAIDKEDYAKYYCTKGRLQALKNDYENAVDLVKEAVCREQPGNYASISQYSLRIMQYQSHLVSIQARGEIHNLNEQQSRMNENVEHIRSSLLNNVEIIAFFSGIISFVIGSLTLAKDSSAMQAAGLIVVLLGALLLVYNCFAMLLHMEKELCLARKIVFAVGSLCIVVGGLVIAFL